MNNLSFQKRLFQQSLGDHFSTHILVSNKHVYTARKNERREKLAVRCPGRSNEKRKTTRDLTGKSRLHTRTSTLSSMHDFINPNGCRPWDVLSLLLGDRSDLRPCEQPIHRPRRRRDKKTRKMYRLSRDICKFI